MYRKCATIIHAPNYHEYLARKFSLLWVEDRFGVGIPVTGMEYRISLSYSPEGTTNRQTDRQTIRILAVSSYVAYRLVVVIISGSVLVCDYSPCCMSFDVLINIHKLQALRPMIATA